MHHLALRRFLPALAFAGSLLVAAPALAEDREVRAGGDLQAALNAAQPGDTIYLEAGATFVGNFVLPVKPGSAYITVRTAGSDTQFPGPNFRITPAHAWLLAKIRSSNTMPALRTAAGAHHWRLQLLEFPHNKEGYGEILQIGDGSSAQTQLSQVPYELELDRLYIHGDPVMGQKRGIALNSGATTIRNSHISDIRAFGADTQAIGGWNGPGPFTIENNYLEAAGENLMLGGADPAIPNLVSENVVIRSNYFSRPMSWRDPIVPTPSSVTATAAAGGTLAPGVHRYRIVANRRVSGGAVARSAASDEITVEVPGGGTGSVRLAWAAIPSTSEYFVYRQAPSGAKHYFRTTSAAFTDSGATGTSGAAPTGAGSAWTVKNLLELKNARNVIIEDNLFENHWAGAQAGYSIVFTPRNQDGSCTWCVVENVSFQRNVVRNVSAGINILGYDNMAPSAQTRNIRIEQNLFYGMSKSLGGNGWFLLLGEAPRDVIVNHNTVDAEGNAVSYVYGGSPGSLKQIYGFKFTNNAVRHNDYGMNGAEAAYGAAIIAGYFPDGVVTGNWMQGGSAARYPAGNHFSGTFASAFLDPAQGDYTPAAGSILLGRGTGGATIGANVPAILSTMRKVMDGQGVKPRPKGPTNLRIVR